MKNQVLVLALVALGTSLFAQKPLLPEAIQKFGTYVQLTQGMYTQGLKVKTFTTVGSVVDNTVNILGDDDKDYTFAGEAEAINYMDGQGFDFVAFVPPSTPLSGVTIFRQILFKRKS